MRHNSRNEKKKKNSHKNCNMDSSLGLCCNISSKHLLNTSAIKTGNEDNYNDMYKLCCKCVIVFPSLI